MPPNALEAVPRAVNRAFDLDVSARTDFDEALLRVLLCVRTAPGGSIRAKEISVQMLKSTSHISRLVDKAEAAGLVERQPDPSDRRAHRIALTDQGRQQIDTYVPHAVELLEQTVCSALSDDELATLIGLLNKVEASSRRVVAEQEASRRRRPG